jgi:ribokinase
MALLAADVDALPDEVFQGPGVFLTCLESPLETVRRGLQRAKRAGLLTVLNPAPANLAILQSGLAPWVDVLTPNEGEAAMLAGAASASSLDPAAAARRLQQLGFKRCVVTLGAQGCMTVEEEAVLAPGHAVSYIDATGAGDAFNGALAVALAEGRSLIEAARWANAAAAIAVTRLGAQPSLPRREEIDRFADG